MDDYRLICSKCWVVFSQQEGKRCSCGDEYNEDFYSFILREGAAIKRHSGNLAARFSHDSRNLSNFEGTGIPEYSNHFQLHYEQYKSQIVFESNENGVNNLNEVNERESHENNFNETISAGHSTAPTIHYFEGLLEHFSNQSVPFDEVNNVFKNKGSNFDYYNFDSHVQNISSNWEIGTNVNGTSKMEHDSLYAENDYSKELTEINTYQPRIFQNKDLMLKDDGPCTLYEHSNYATTRYLPEQHQDVNIEISRNVFGTCKSDQSIISSTEKYPQEFIVNDASATIRSEFLSSDIKTLKEALSPNYTHVCEVCGKEFRYRSLLKRHKPAHSTEIPYECDVCGKKYKSELSLQRHKETHSSENQYMCEVCGKAFNSEYSFTQHRRIHFLKYFCEVCGKGFPKRNVLEIHKRTHSSDKPFKCEVCGKAFVSESLVGRHKLTHSSEKPYECEVCEKKFSLKCYLKKHKLIHLSD